VFDFLEGEVEYDGKVWNLKPGCWFGF
jgi:hypothetical protein